ncbi:hypothetical protein GCM10028792_26010 [Salinisphaera aquimarina]
MFGRGYGTIQGQTQPDPACPELAVGAVAMGDKYADWCLTMITSLRARGQYRGPIYVITDLPALFTDLENVRVLAVPSTRHRLIAKGCKQVLMRLIDEPVFLYLDSDLVITSPLREWYDTMKPCLADVPVLCYSDVKPYDNAYHGGVVLIDVKRGMPIVKRWQQVVRSGAWGSDQACLYSVAGDDGPGHLPDTGFMFLRNLINHEDQITCIVHVTNGALRDYSRAELESYLSEKLGVTRIPSSFD